MVHGRDRGCARHPARGGASWRRPRRGSASTEILEAIVERVPPPQRRPARAAPRARLRLPLRPVQGRGRLRAGRHGNAPRPRADPFMATGAESDILELGYFRPSPVATRSLTAGEVGYVATGLKSIRDVRVGDTLTSAGRPAAEPLPGYKEPRRSSSLASTRCAATTTRSCATRSTGSTSTTPASPTSRSRARRARLRVPLRLPRPAAHGDRAAAARARIRPRPHRDRAERRVSGQGHARSRRGVVDNPAEMPGAGDIEAISEPWVSTEIITPTDYIGADHGARHDPPRHVRAHGVPRRAPREPPLRDAARRADHRLLRPAEEPLVRVREPRLQLPGLPARRPRQARRAG